MENRWQDEGISWSLRNIETKENYFLKSKKYIYFFVFFLSKHRGSLTWQDIAHQCFTLLCFKVRHANTEKAMQQTHAQTHFYGQTIAINQRGFQEKKSEKNERQKEDKEKNKEWDFKSCPFPSPGCFYLRFPFLLPHYWTGQACAEQGMHRPGLFFWIHGSKKTADENGKHTHIFGKMQRKQMCFLPHPWLAKAKQVTIGTKSFCLSNNCRMVRPLCSNKEVRQKAKAGMRQCFLHPVW